MGVTETLARFIVDKGYNDIPAQVVSTAKERIIDMLAVTVAGSVEKCTTIALDVVTEMGGHPSASILCHRLKTSAPNAAFVNGIQAHAPEMGDTHLGPNHIGEVIVPAILTMADALGASGKQVLEAFVLAWEAEVRIGSGVLPAQFTDKGWHIVSTLGSLGAVVGCSKLLGLDLDKTRYALGIAASAAGGIRKNVPTMTKPFHAGYAAKNGVLCALLAKRGFTADIDVLEGVPGIGHDHFGFCECFNGEGNYNLDKMVEELGTRWDLALPNTTSKRHPGVTVLAVPIDIVLDLVNKHDIKPEDVERVDVGITRWAMTTGSHMQPRNSREARYSTRYAVAVSLLDRKAGLQQFTDERVARSDVQSFLEKVNVSIDPALDEERNRPEAVRRWGAARLTVKLKGGRQFSDRRGTAKGYPEMPMEWDDLVEKYHDCAEYARASEKGINIDRSIALVKELENLGNIRQLIECLTPQ